MNVVVILAVSSLEFQVETDRKERGAMRSLGGGDDHAGGA
jgi:hypothetical protein